MEEAKPRTRRRHDRDLKSKVLAACQAPGASVAKVALDHGLNANLVHKWRRETPRAQAHRAVADAATQFIPVAMAPAAGPVPDIRIEVRRSATTITVAWPLAGAAECASWMRELLR
jgi:transposase